MANYHCILPIILLLSLPNGCLLIPALPEAACISHIRPGDVYLSGIFSFHFSWGGLCRGGLNDFAVQLAEMMIFEIERINSRDDILPNVTIGYVIRDDCGSEDIALWSAMTLVNKDGTNSNTNLNRLQRLSCPNQPNSSAIHEPLVGIVGTPFSFTTLLVARLGSLYNLPVISYWATTDELSDKSRFPFFLRTVPPDEFQAGAMIDLLVRFQWKYVILLYSVEGYGIHGARQLRTFADHNGICIALTLAVQPGATESELIEMVNKLKDVPKAKVVLAFARSEQVYDVMQVMDKMKMNLGLTWIGSDSWGYELMENGYGYLAEGSFFIRVDQNVVPDFKKHFDELNLDTDDINPWLKQYWLDSKSCSNWEDCPLPVEPYGTALFNAVDAYAQVLHAIQEETCNGNSGCVDWHSISGQLILDKLNEGLFQGIDGEFEFDENGNVADKYNLVNLQKRGEGYELVPVGHWDPKSEDMLNLDWDVLKFTNDTQDVPVSLCKEDCDLGYIVVPLEQKCCYGCKRCPANAIVVNKTECESCAITHWPDKDFVRCDPIRPARLPWSDPLIVTLLALTSLGLALALLTVCGLMVYRNHALIKATSRELSAVNIAGVTLGLVSVFPLLVHPTRVTCPISETLISLCFTFMYVPTLLKVIRIYRIFKAGRKSKKRPRFVSSKAQLVLSALAVGFQILIVIISSILSPSKPDFIYTSPPSQHIELFCMFGTGFIASCVYNLVIIIICCCFAFKARKVPSNYNESKFIAVSVYSTLLVCLAATPVYTTAIFAKQKVATLCMVLLVNTYLTLICVYLPKLYAILFVDDDLNVQEWRTSRIGSETTRMSSINTMSSNLRSTAQVHPATNTLAPPGSVLFGDLNPHAARDDSKISFTSSITIFGAERPSPCP